MLIGDNVLKIALPLTLQRISILTSSELRIVHMSSTTWWDANHPRWACQSNTQSSPHSGCRLLQKEFSGASPTDRPTSFPSDSSSSQTDQHVLWNLSFHPQDHVWCSSRKPIRHSVLFYDLEPLWNTCEPIAIVENQAARSSDDNYQKAAYHWIVPLLQKVHLCIVMVIRLSLI